MKSALIHIRGLGDTDPSGDWCGAKLHVQSLAMKYGLYVIDANWDDKDADLLVDHARSVGAEFVAVTGHSHGAWRAGEIAKRYGPEAFDFLGLIDYCPFMEPAKWMGPPLDFPVAARTGFAVWQHNSIPTGCKFNSRDKVLCVDATPARDPKLGHIDYPGMSSIAGDERVWGFIETILSAALRDRQFTATDPSPSPAVAPLPHDGAAAMARNDSAPQAAVPFIRAGTDSTGGAGGLEPLEPRTLASALPALPHAPLLTPAQAYTVPYRTTPVVRGEM